VPLRLSTYLIRPRRLPFLIGNAWLILSGYWQKSGHFRTYLFGGEIAKQYELLELKEAGPGRLTHIIRYCLYTAGFCIYSIEQGKLFLRLKGSEGFVVFRLGLDLNLLYAIAQGHLLFFRQTGSGKLVDECRNAHIFSARSIGCG
jgi:hypothetical protein